MGTGRKFSFYLHKYISTNTPPALVVDLIDSMPKLFVYKTNGSTYSVMILVGLKDQHQPIKETESMDMGMLHHQMDHHKYLGLPYVLHIVCNALLLALA